jgi:site-specific DNA-methyltransferase (adenine-specific)
MGHARYLVGDVYDRLKEIPDGSIDLVVTSPPFLALRSYLPVDHPNKDKEIGSEATPAAFLDTLLALTAEWRRVLAPHGSIAVELGDTYSGVGGTSSAPNPAYSETRSMERKDGDLLGAGRGWRKAEDLKHWPLDKSLSGIPTLYAWSLAYGRNLLTGQPSPAGQWRIRNLLVWARPNPPVGALGDKWRPATSYVTVACVGRQRYFDLDAVRTEPARPDSWRTGADVGKKAGRLGGGDSDSNGGKGYYGDNPAGAPPLDWCDERDTNWQPLMPLPTQPYSGSHYATFPTQLPKRLIECMAPQRVCRECGKPSERVVESELVGLGGSRGTKADELGNTTTMERTARRATTLGFTDCGHNAWRPGIVLDPFAGSGTTLAAATGCGRDAIGIDLDERNADLARDRVGMFLEIEACAVLTTERGTKERKVERHG